MKAACRARAEAILGRPLTANEVQAVDAYVAQAAQQAATSNPSKWRNNNPKEKASDVAAVATANYQQALLHNYDTLANNANILTGLRHELFSNPNATPQEVLLRMLEATTDQKGIRSFENDAEVTGNRYAAMISEVFESTKHFGIVLDRDKLNNVVIEFYNSGRTGNTDAQQLATDIKNMIDVVNKELELYGHRVEGDAQLPQSHSSHMIALSGEAQWISDTLPLLNTSKMVDINTGAPLSTAEIQTRLEDTYRIIVSDGAYNSAANNPVAGVSTSHTTVDKVYKDLPFKDGESYLEYHKLYSESDNFMDLMSNYAIRAGQQVSLSRRFGSDYKQTLIQLKEDAKLEMLKDPNNQNPKMSKSIRKLDVSIAQATDIATNKVMAVDSVWRDVGTTLRATTSANTLGSSGIAQFTDYVSQMVIGRLSGISGSKAISESLGNLVAGNKGFAELTGVGMKENLSSISRFGSADITLNSTFSGKVAGIANKVNSQVLKVAGLSRITRSNKQAYASVTMKSWSDFATNTAWKDIPVKNKKVIEGNGLTEQDFNLWKKVVQDDVNGTKMLTINSFFKKSNLSDADLISHYNINTSSMTAKQLDDHLYRLREQAGTKYANAVETELNAVVPEMKNAEQRVLYGTNNPGMIPEILLKSVFQFKSFVVPMVNKVLRRAWAQGGKTKYTLLAALFTAYTTIGYVINTARDLVSGKDPENPFTAKAFTRAVLAGGGTLVIGDILVKAIYDKKVTSADLLSVASLKPIDSGLKVGIDALKVLQDDKELSDLAQTSIKEGTSNIPGQNLIWTRAMYSLLVDAAHNAVDEDYVQKRNDRQERDYNITRWATTDGIRLPEINNLEYDKD